MMKMYFNSDLVDFNNDLVDLFLLLLHLDTDVEPRVPHLKSKGGSHGSPVVLHLDPHDGASSRLTLRLRDWSPKPREIFLQLILEPAIFLVIDNLEHGQPIINH